MSPRFVRVARTSDIDEKRGKLVHLENEEICVWRVDGIFYAINNVCPHQHLPSLHQGTLDGKKITCPMHGWTFSLETGAAHFGNGRLKTYRVKVEGEHVLVEKPADSW
jgi:nitrite reductase/ring-hydroxylating ferredoxin subunit